VDSGTAYEFESGTVSHIPATVPTHMSTSTYHFHACCRFLLSICRCVLAAVPPLTVLQLEGRPFGPPPAPMFSSHLVICNTVFYWCLIVLCRLCCVVYADV
jgi:hypothetical protein